MQINIDFDKCDKEIFELSFIPKYKRDTEYLNVVVNELTEIRDGHISVYGITPEVLKLQEVILNYSISLKEAKGEDYSLEMKSLEYLLSLSY